MAPCGLTIEQRRKPPSKYVIQTLYKLAYFRDSKNLTHESCAKAPVKEGFKVLKWRTPRKLEMIAYHKF